MELETGNEGNSFRKWIPPRMPPNSDRSSISELAPAVPTSQDGCAPCSVRDSSRHRSYVLVAATLRGAAPAVAQSSPMPNQSLREPSNDLSSAHLRALSEAVLVNEAMMNVPTTVTDSVSTQYERKRSPRKSNEVELRRGACNCCHSTGHYWCDGASKRIRSPASPNGAEHSPFWREHRNTPARANYWAEGTSQRAMGSGKRQRVEISKQ